MMSIGVNNGRHTGHSVTRKQWTTAPEIAPVERGTMRLARAVDLPGVVGRKERGPRHVFICMYIFAISPMNAIKTVAF